MTVLIFGYFGEFYRIVIKSNRIIRAIRISSAITEGLVE